MGKIKWNKNQLKKIEEGKKKALVLLGYFIVNDLKKEVERKGVIDTGNYIRSFYSRTYGDVLRVGNTKKYTIIIEYGRRPGKYPPLDALVGWTARKFNLPGKTLKYKDTKGKLKQLTYLVGRAIAKKGIEGKKIFGNVINTRKTEWFNFFYKKYKDLVL